MNAMVACMFAMLATVILAMILRFTILRANKKVLKMEEGRRLDRERFESSRAGELVSSGRLLML